MVFNTMFLIGLFLKQSHTVTKIMTVPVLCDYSREYSREICNRTLQSYCAGNNTECQLYNLRVLSSFFDANTGI